MSDEIEFEGLDGERPVWPKVIGIVSIVLAAIGVTCGGLGAAFMVLQGSMFEGMLNGDPPPPTMVMGPIDYTLAGVGTLFTIVLLVAGILTVMRKPAGRIAHLVYAIPTIPIQLFAMMHNFEKQAAVKDWVEQYPNNDIAKGMAQQGEAGQIAGLIVSMTILFTLGVAYPLFLAIWFAMVKTKPEQMTGGVDEVI